MFTNQCADGTINLFNAWYTLVLRLSQIVVMFVTIAKLNIGLKESALDKWLLNKLHALLQMIKETITFLKIGMLLIAEATVRLFADGLILHLLCAFNILALLI